MGAVEFLFKINELSRPGFEPGLVQAQRNVPTTRRSGPAFLVYVSRTLNFVFPF